MISKYLWQCLLTDSGALWKQHKPKIYPLLEHHTQLDTNNKAEKSDAFRPALQLNLNQ